MPATATIVEVSSRTFDIPLDCPCCGAPPDTEISVPLARTNQDRASTSARSVDFPYCRACVAHVARWESAGIIVSGLVVIGGVAGVAVALASQVVNGVIVLAATTAFALVIARSRRADARRQCRESCGSPNKSVAYLGWSGTSTVLTFQSISYAAKFAERNSSKLVDSRGIRGLLEKYKLARIAVPTPAAAIAAIPPPLELGEWVERLATAPSRVVRRSSLARALAMFDEPKQREQLVRTVCAIEIAALCAPLDAMPSATAKRRHLELAIAQIRHDNLPDELQQAMLRELERHRARLVPG